MKGRILVLYQSK